MSVETVRGKHIPSALRKQPPATHPPLHKIYVRISELLSVAFLDLIHAQHNEESSDFGFIKRLNSIAALHVGNSTKRTPAHSDGQGAVGISGSAVGVDGSTQPSPYVSQAQRLTPVTFSPRSVTTSSQMLSCGVSALDWRTASAIVRQESFPCWSVSPACAFHSGREAGGMRATASSSLPESHNPSLLRK